MMKDLMRLLQSMNLSPTPGVEVPRSVPPIPPGMSIDEPDWDTYEPWDPETDEEDDPTQVDENGVCIAEPGPEDRKHVIH
ncbi:hypothetical protein [Acidithiobacillus ferrooxidans]|uniref:hypothetical protein n=1 Tax=Acidithiobacillus ferrooxidans TaxID=920 RepID=UPI0013D385F3|nr:hypothetical protein [Acidithiobacillus ferrooxidans]